MITGKLATAKPLMLVVNSICVLAVMAKGGELSAAKSGKFRVHRDIVYVQRESGPLLADVYQPGGKGPFPGVLVIYGGGWTFGDKSQMRYIASRLAESGYTAVSINYRRAPQHIFPSQLEDCRAAIKWLVDHAAEYKVDSNALAAYGYSAGGQLALLLAMQDRTNDGTPADVPRLFALVAGAAPCDFRDFPPQSPVLAYYLGGSRQSNQRQYELASPANFVSPEDPPTFLYHGLQDGLVDVSNSKSLEKLLKDAAVEVESYWIPSAGHLGAFVNREAMEKAIAFLEQHRPDSGLAAGSLVGSK